MNVLCSWIVLDRASSLFSVGLVMNFKSFLDEDVDVETWCRLETWVGRLDVVCKSTVDYGPTISTPHPPT